MSVCAVCSEYSECTLYENIKSAIVWIRARKLKDKVGKIDQVLTKLGDIIFLTEQLVSKES